MTNSTSRVSVQITDPGLQDAYKTANDELDNAQYDGMIQTRKRTITTGGKARTVSMQVSLYNNITNPQDQLTTMKICFAVTAFMIGLGMLSAPLKMHQFITEINMPLWCGYSLSLFLNVSIAILLSTTCKTLSQAVALVVFKDDFEVLDYETDPMCADREEISLSSLSTRYIGSLFAKVLSYSEIVALVFLIIAYGSLALEVAFENRPRGKFSGICLSGVVVIFILALFVFFRLSWAPTMSMLATFAGLFSYIIVTMRLIYYYIHKNSEAIPDAVNSIRSLTISPNLTNENPLVAEAKEGLRLLTKAALDNVVESETKDNFSFFIRYFGVFIEIFAAHFSSYTAVLSILSTTVQAIRPNRTKTGIYCAFALAGAIYVLYTVTVYFLLGEDGTDLKIYTFCKEVHNTENRFIVGMLWYAMSFCIEVKCITTVLLVMEQLFSTMVNVFPTLSDVISVKFIRFGVLGLSGLILTPLAIFPNTIDLDYAFELLTAFVIIPVELILIPYLSSVILNKSMSSSYTRIHFFSITIGIIYLLSYAFVKVLSLSKGVAN